MTTRSAKNGTVKQTEASEARGLDPRVAPHALVFLRVVTKTWMAGTSPAMTAFNEH